MINRIRIFKMFVRRTRSRVKLWTLCLKCIVSILILWGMSRTLFSKHPCASPPIARPRFMVMPSLLSPMRWRRTWILFPGSKIVRARNRVVRRRATMEWFVRRSSVVRCSLQWWRYCFKIKKRYRTLRNRCKQLMIRVQVFKRSYITFKICHLPPLKWIDTVYVSYHILSYCIIVSYRFVNHTDLQFVSVRKGRKINKYPFV